MHLCETLGIPSVRMLLEMVSATDIMRWVAYKSIEVGDDAPAVEKPKAKTPGALFDYFKTMTIKAGGKVN